MYFLGCDGGPMKHSKSTDHFNNDKLYKSEANMKHYNNNM